MTSKLSSFKLFGNKNTAVSSNGTQPDGEVATTIIDICTNPASAEVDWTAVFTTVELIKGYYETPTPLEGCTQAVKAIRYRLSSMDPDACVSEEPVPHELQGENRGQALEVFADWASKDTRPPEIWKFFETLVKSGFRFSPTALSKFNPANIERMKGMAPGGRVQVVPSVVQPLLSVQPLRLEIDQVSFEERQKWVQFDCDVAGNCIQVLLETLNFADQSQDLSRNEIGNECFSKCCEVLRRIATTLPKVAEPALIAKLITATADVTAALQQYNNIRLAQEQGFVLPNLIEVPEFVPYSIGSDTAFKVTENEKEKGSTGKGKGKLVQFEASEDENAAGPSLHQFEE
ncbi:hypothetical protein HK100_004745 [Physocladia obscura]|uniref:VHS domain-containing protein n=1 Tax=Physocladia obscura TaxID=109957 RepID=A0AAD5XKQ9_9FUNG|nr:hypothetical protein HK100_004745 [Physocladia obscura]